MPVTRGGSLSFDNAFAFYGDSQSSIADEVKADLKRAIETAIGSVAFNRSEGFGIAGLENDSLTEGKIAFIKFFIASAVANYNANAPVSKRVLSSQEVILVETNSDGEAYIKIYYVLASNLNLNSTPEPTALEFSTGI